MTRRRLLTWLINGVGLVVGGVLVVPPLVTALSPLFRGRRDEAWRALGPIEQFPVGEVTKGLIGIGADPWPPGMDQQAVYVWRPVAGEVIVFSRSCTDLGCPVNYDPGSEVFYCPCHGGIFNKDGERMAGPPERPLYRYANRIRDGIVEIDLTSVPPMA